MTKSRKNKMLLVVAIVVMVCLVIGMGVMTYSKYITEGSTSQNATAAKWGFVVNVNADTFFGRNYNATADNTLATVVTTDGVAVKASESAGNIVAPGTSGSMTISISGSAEVLSKLTFSHTGDIKEIFVSGTTVYNPIKWTLNDGTSDLVTNGTLAAVIAKLESTNATIEAGDSYTKNYTITWKWDLNGGDDARDTLIGYKAAGKTYDDIKNLSVGGTALNTIVTNAEAYNNGIATELAFNLSIKVEQIQVKTPA